jgi:cell division transport system permease protein
MRAGFFVSEALESLRRNWVMTIASVVTVVVTMAILGLALVTDRNLTQGATSLKNRVEIEVFIKDEVSSDPAQVRAMAAQIAAIPDVRRWDYVTKDQAWARFVKSLGPDWRQITGGMTHNPLPASFEIYVKDPAQVDRVAARFFSDPRVDNDAGTTDGVSYAKRTVRNLLGTIDLVERGLWVVTALLALAAVLLVSATVRLSIFARRREIEVMQLVGATPWFIRWPFVVEGFLTGLFGALAASALVWFGNRLVVDWVHSSKLDFLGPKVYPALLQGGPWPFGLAPTLALMGSLVGAAGSVVALRRHLRTGS